MIDLARGSGLDDLAGIHHHHPVGDIGNHAEIVRDEEHAHAHLGLEFLEQLEHLRLNRHVKCRGRLVGDHDVGLVGEGHRDHDALPLAARELVRILVHRRFRLRHPDPAHQLEGTRGGLRCRDAMDAHDLAQLPADGVDRVEMAERVLEHHGDALAVDGPALRGRQCQQVASIEQDLP